MNNRTSMTFNRFKSLILEQIQQELTEASTKWSTMFEQIICESWNIWRKADENNPPKVTQLAGYGDKDVQQNSDCNTAFELSKNIYESIKLANILTKDDELAKLPNQPGSVTEIWKLLGLYSKAPNNTPKTDIFADNIKTFSVKADTGNQLMSGTVNELLATVIVGIVKAYPKDINNIYAKCNNLIENCVGVRFNFNNISKLINDKNYNKKLSESDLYEIVKQDTRNAFFNNRIKISGEVNDFIKKPDETRTKLGTNDFNKQNKQIQKLRMVQSNITNLVNDLIKDKQIKDAIYYEAASGEIKFGNSVSTANFVLVWNKSGICTIKTINDYLMNSSHSYKTSSHFKSSSNKSSIGDKRSAWTIMSISGGKAKKK